jgi:spore maturation protein CgeB
MAASIICAKRSVPKARTSRLSTGRRRASRFSFVPLARARGRTGRASRSRTSLHSIGFVWIGNFGDGERTEEIAEFLLEPADRASLPLDVYGVRYPDEVLQRPARHGGLYRGWLANAEVPAVFARYLATAHVPRRFYATHLPGIPTIRVLEALACGMPVVSAPWHDAEHLFRPGTICSPVTVLP